MSSARKAGSASTHHYHLECSPFRQPPPHASPFPNLLLTATVGLVTPESSGPSASSMASVVVVATAPALLAGGTSFSLFRVLLRLRVATASIEASERCAPLRAAARRVLLLLNELRRGTRVTAWRTWRGRIKTPWPGGQEKYRSPSTLPSFFPSSEKRSRREREKEKENDQPQACLCSWEYFQFLVRAHNSNVT